MGEKIVVGPINSGLKNDRTPFVINNDSFPVLYNAYQFRGRVKRKRGTAQLGRLTKFFNSTVSSYNSGSTTITLNGSGVGNLLTGFSLETNGNIVPGSVTITAPGPTLYTDPSMNGTLSPSGSINYASGQITIVAQAGAAVSAIFRYTPNLPVLGIEDLDLNVTESTKTLAFDTKYSYNISTNDPYPIYNVSFYKNPPTGTPTNYVEKTNITPTTWNGQDYQQFWTANYQAALWATNGITIPYSTTNLGMQFKRITNVVIGGGPAVTATLTIATHGLVVGDFLFINEVGGITGINFQTGFVTVVVDPNNVTVEFPNATLAGVYTPNTGIAQYLTNRSDTTKDCLRWYDGDPTNAVSTNPQLNGHFGWVNFCPALSQNAFSISELPPAKYYLVGARIIFPFKDRILFLGPVVQTSAVGATPKYLPDTVIYSQNGTPFYTASFTGDPVAANTEFNELLVPTNQTASAATFFCDQSGFGGFIQIGVQKAISSVALEDDVLILGFESNRQMKCIYTSNDLSPFAFYTINSELGTSSTFSTINLDRGVISRGDQGFIITSEDEAKRIDADIPDEVFQMRLNDNGRERVCSERDYINEWIYFSYLSNTNTHTFPTETLQYNYRDDTWAKFSETYTTYGSFRKRTGLVWENVGLTYPTWEVWNDPWESGVSTVEQPLVLGGNQQGFVMIRGVGTGEGASLQIRSFSGSTITSPNHCMTEGDEYSPGDYFYISGCLGTIASQVNGKVFSVGAGSTQDEIVLNPSIGSGTYLGGGTITRMYVPFIQTKQFPVSWGMARKTRLGPQQYLFTKTSSGQIQLLIYLSQNDSSPYNKGGIVPAANVDNSSLIYSTILYTCPESTNLGLTPANINLQTPTASRQSQIWHRKNTSLIGDTVQIGFTLSDTQMRDPNLVIQFEEIDLHGFILDVSPSQLLA